MLTLKKTKEAMQYILVTDVGSTTTKARFFHKRDGEWRFLVAGEAPTTVEAPYEDVTLGVRNAVREVEELTDHRILSSDASGIVVPYDGEMGVDLYCTTSSAGGGLQMMVAGVALSMTAESANRAALGAGAIVVDAIAIDDGREDFEKIKRMRNLRPDMILLAGGTDGGTIEYVMELAELIKSAKIKPRLGVNYELPLVYAGNKYACNQVEELLKDEFNLLAVENIRPVLEVENTEPARRAIHDLFMEHVMSHAPGYAKLMMWSDVDIMPTPAGEGLAMQLISKTLGKNTIGVGLGGATTNVYSIFEGRFVRSVSANLGMSYSICNVLKETGIKNISRWLPFNIDEVDITNRLRNKMIRPTTIPQTLKDLMIEHAVAREALRLGLEHHKTLATRLKGALRKDYFERAISREKEEETYIRMLEISIIAGTGGLLSHAPRRTQSLLILTDGFQPEGVTRLFQDSVFMMPHLGILSTVFPEAAWSIFDKDCLIRLGTVIAPVGGAKKGEAVLDITLEMPDGSTLDEKLNFGEIFKIPLATDEEATIVLSPRSGFDVGAGLGKRLEDTIFGGVVGVLVDGRGRPLTLPKEDGERRRLLLKWFKALDLYSEDLLSQMEE